jgi:hypothetical protein
VGSRDTGELLVSHLLFANDNLIFFKAKLDHFHHLSCPYLCFEVVSGLKII